MVLRKFKNFGGHGSVCAALIAVCTALHAPVAAAVEDAAPPAPAAVTHAAPVVVPVSAMSTLRSLFWGPEPAPAPPPDPTRIPDSLVDKETPWGPLQIVVYKSRRKLAVYRFGKLDREYAVVLGFKPDGRKRFAHDARTPEGKYRIMDKRPHERWQYFLAIDYPNDTDKAVYAAELAGGKIPDIGGQPFGIGSGLGIHGNDKPQEQAAGKDWTKGCVAMRENDIAELYAMVEVGTPVWLVQ